MTAKITTTAIKETINTTVRFVVDVMRIASPSIPSVCVSTTTNARFLALFFSNFQKPL